MIILFYFHFQQKSIYKSSGCKKNMIEITDENSWF